jgi:hypothetical protein
MANDRQELEDLRRLDELERKASGKAAASTQDKPAQRLGTPLEAFGEPIAAMGTGMLAKPLSDVAGLGAIPLHAAGLINREPAAVQEAVRRGLTYEPRTRLGQAVNEYNPLALLGKGIGWAGEQAGRGVEQIGLPPTVAGPAASGVREAVTQIPTFLGIKAPPAAAAASAGLRGGAERMMHSALKPGVKYAKTADPAIDTLLEKGINVTPGGLEKLHAMIDDKNSRIGALIDNSPAVIDKTAVASRLQDVLQRFEKQVNPKADLAAIEKAWEEFLDHPLLTGKDIPIKTAQELKRGTYTQLKGKYGELGSAETEAQKALARGLKEEIANAVPEVRQLNAEESKLLQALPMVERRVIVSANKNPVGLGLLSMNPKNIAVWMADRSELFKSLVARMLNTGSRAMPRLDVMGPVGGMAITQQANQLPPPPQ